MPFTPPETDEVVRGRFVPPETDVVVSEPATGEPAAPERSGSLAFLNRGIASVLGAPGDIVNLMMMLGEAAGEAVGLKTGVTIPAAPGREAVEAGMRGVGIAVPRRGELAEGPAALIAQSAGAAVGGLPLAPALAVVRGAGAGTQAIRAIGETAVRRPGLMTTGEIAAGVGAGGGQAIARELFPDNEVAEVLGAMAGGLGLPALPTVAFGVSGGRLATRIARSQAAGFTEAGRQQQASDRLRQLANVDAPQVERRLREPGVIARAGLSPAQVSGNRRLLALEKAVLDADPRLADEAQRRFTMANRVVRDEIRGLSDAGSVDATRNFIGERRDYLLGLMNERVKRARVSAVRQVERLGPSADRASINMVVRNEIEDALSDAVRTEREIWNALPLDVTVSTNSTRGALLGAVRGLVKGETLNDLPAEFRRFLARGEKGKVRITLNGSEPANVLQKMRSRALEEARIARSAGKRNEARLLDSLQEAILADMGALEGQVTGQLGESYRSALSFSRQLNEKFRRSTVGNLLGYERTGGASVAPELTLERAIRPGSRGAGVATDDILRAVDEAPGIARTGLEEFVKTMFAEQSARPNGTFDPTAADRFIGRNEALLNRFPGLRLQFREAARSGRLSEDLAARVDTLIKGLHDKRVSRAALFLDAPVEQEIRSVLRDPNPRLAARGLKRMVGRDRSGEAGKGLRAALSEFIMRTAGTGRFDAGGAEILSGRSVRRNILNDPRVMSVVDEIFDAGQRKRLGTIVGTLERMETAAAALPDVGGIIDPANTPILEFAARTLGARLGAQAGAGTTGASLLTAHFGAQRMRQIMGAFADRVARGGARQLLVDAVQDKDLMLALMTRPDTAAKQKLITQRLHGWLIGLGDQRVNSILAEGDDRERRAQ